MECSETLGHILTEECIQRVPGLVEIPASAESQTLFWDFQRLSDSPYHVRHPWSRWFGTQSFGKTCDAGWNISCPQNCQVIEIGWLYFLFVVFSIPTLSWKRCATFKLHLLGCSPFPSQTIELCEWNLQPGQNQGWGFAPNCQGLVSITLGGIVSAMPPWVKSVSPSGISRLFPNVDVLQMPTWVSWPHICRMPCFLCCLHNKHLSSPRVLHCTGCSLP